MAFKLWKGRAHIEWYPKLASTAYTNGDLVHLVAGGLTVADATSVDHVGVIQQTFTTSDTTTAEAPVLVPHDETVWEVEFADTLTSSMIGQFHTLTDGNTVNAAATNPEQVCVVGVVNSTLGLVKINEQANYSST